jgi:1,3-beta-glucan synthase
MSGVNPCLCSAFVLSLLLRSSGNGFFINTAITMVSVHASLWAYLLLALGKVSNADVQATLSAVQLLQLGTLSVLVYLFTLGLELGMFRAAWTIMRQTLQGGS